MSSPQDPRSSLAAGAPSQAIFPKSEISIALTFDIPPMAAGRPTLLVACCWSAFRS